VLGRGLRDLPRDQIVVSTKVGRYGQEAFDFSSERVTASVHESLARLQVGACCPLQLGCRGWGLGVQPGWQAADAGADADDADADG
jgi:hypothetical protein